MTKNMKEITELDVLSVAKIQSLIAVVIGFLIGLFTLIMTLFSASLSFVTFIAALIFIPILYGIFGFIGGALGSWLYNKFASKIGGVKLSLK